MSVPYSKTSVAVDAPWRQDRRLARRVLVRAIVEPAVQASIEATSTCATILTSVAASALRQNELRADHEQGRNGSFGDSRDDVGPLDFSQDVSGVGSQFRPQLEATGTDQAAQPN